MAEENLSICQGCGWAAPLLDTDPRDCPRCGQAAAPLCLPKSAQHTLERYRFLFEAIEGWKEEGLIADENAARMEAPYREDFAQWLTSVGQPVLLAHHERIITPPETQTSDSEQSRAVQDTENAVEHRELAPKEAVGNTDLAIPSENVLRPSAPSEEAREDERARVDVAPRERAPEETVKPEAILRESTSAEVFEQEESDVADREEVHISEEEIRQRAVDSLAPELASDAALASDAVLAADAVRPAPPKVSLGATISYALGIFLVLSSGFYLLSLAWPGLSPTGRHTTVWSVLGMVSLGFAGAGALLQRRYALTAAARWFWLVSTGLLGCSSLAAGLLWQEQPITSFGLWSLTSLGGLAWGYARPGPALRQKSWRMDLSLGALFALAGAAIVPVLPAPISVGLLYGGLPLLWRRAALLRDVTPTDATEDFSARWWRRALWAGPLLYGNFLIAAVSIWRLLDATQFTEQLWLYGPAWIGVGLVFLEATPVKKQGRISVWTGVCSGFCVLGCALLFSQEGVWVSLSGTVAGVFVFLSAQRHQQRFIGTIGLGLIWFWSALLWCSSSSLWMVHNGLFALCTALCAWGLHKKNRAETSRFLLGKIPQVALGFNGVLVLFDPLLTDFVLGFDPWRPNLSQLASHTSIAGIGVLLGLGAHHRQAKCSAWFAAGGVATGILLLSLSIPRWAGVESVSLSPVLVSVVGAFTLYEIARRFAPVFWRGPLIGTASGLALCALLVVWTSQPDGVRLGTVVCGGVFFARAAIVSQQKRFGWLFYGVYLIFIGTLTHSAGWLAQAQTFALALVVSFVVPVTLLWALRSRLYTEPGWRSLCAPVANGAPVLALCAGFALAVTCTGAYADVAQLSWPGMIALWIHAGALFVAAALYRSPAFVLSGVCAVAWAIFGALPDALWTPAAMLGILTGVSGAVTLISVFLPRRSVQEHDVSSGLDSQERAEEKGKEEVQNQSLPPEEIKAPVVGSGIWRLWSFGARHTGADLWGWSFETSGLFLGLCIAPTALVCWFAALFDAWVVSAVLMVGVAQFALRFSRVRRSLWLWLVSLELSVVVGVYASLLPGLWGKFIPLFAVSAFWCCLEFVSLQLAKRFAKDWLPKLAGIAGGWMFVLLCFGVPVWWGVGVGSLYREELSELKLAPALTASLYAVVVATRGRGSLGVEGFAFPAVLLLPGVVCLLPLHAVVVAGLFSLAALKTAWLQRARARWWVLLVLSFSFGIRAIGLDYLEAPAGSLLVCAVSLGAFALVCLLPKLFSFQEGYAGIERAGLALLSGALVLDIGVMVVPEHQGVTALQALWLYGALLVQGAVWLRLGARRQKAWMIYLCVALWLGIHTHLRVVVGHGFETIDAWIFLGWAFVLSGLGEFLKRRAVAQGQDKENFGAKTSMRAAWWMPWLALSVALVGVEGFPVGLWLGMSVWFGAVLWQTGQRGYVIPATVLLNLEILSLWWGAGVADPLLYVLPVGLSLLVFAAVFRKELGKGGVAALQILGCLCIYVCGLVEVVAFYSIVDVLVLAGLSMAGIAMGAWLRIRSYLYLGALFLVLDVAVNLFRIGLQDRIVGMIFLFGTGVLILASVVAYSVRREAIQQRLQGLREHLDASESTLENPEDP